jgi:hypothetical protein
VGGVGAWEILNHYSPSTIHHPLSTIANLE